MMMKECLIRLLLWIRFDILNDANQQESIDVIRWRERRLIYCFVDVICSECNDRQPTAQFFFDIHKNVGHKRSTHIHWQFNTFAKLSVSAAHTRERFDSTLQNQIAIHLWHQIAWLFAPRAELFPKEITKSLRRSVNVVRPSLHRMSAENVNNYFKETPKGKWYLLSTEIYIHANMNISWSAVTDFFDFNAWMAGL